MAEETFGGVAVNALEKSSFHAKGWCKELQNICMGDLQNDNGYANISSMENGTVVAEKSKSGNKVWIVLLVVLFVAIVGLIVGIVVVKNTKKDSDMACAGGDSVYDINTCISNKYSEADNLDQAKSLYRGAIDKAVAEGEYAQAGQLIADRSSFLVLEGDCEDAMRLMGEENVEYLSDEEKGVFYSYALSMDAYCGGTNQDFWSGLLNQANERMDWTSHGD